MFGGLAIDESGKALAKGEETSPAVSTVEAVAMSMQATRGRRVERMAGVSKRRVDHIETMDGPEILNSVEKIEKLDKVARRTFERSSNPSRRDEEGIRCNVVAEEA